MIQQNIGESINKGFILWTINNMCNITHRFVDIPNDYGYVRVDVRGLSRLEADKMLAIKPPNINSRVSLISDADDILLKEQIHKLSSSFGRVDKISRFLKIDNGKGLADDILTSLDEMLVTFGASDQQRKDILEMHSKTIGNHISTPRKWTILNMRWSNLLIYGMNNYIDFTKFEGGLSGVVAGNMMGKSSIIDILVYGLFNKMLRADKSSIINIVEIVIY
jgi:hypothetical protein